MAASCQYDSECADTEYCSATGTCTTYTSSTICMRSLDCYFLGHYCDVPGTTSAAKCPECSDSTPQARGCHCGIRKNCKTCGETRDDICGSCYDGYQLVNGFCTGKCQVDAATTEACYCGTVYCNANMYCQNWDNSLFCWKEEMKNCCTFGSLKVSNCAECEDTNLSLCKMCSKGYELKDNKCTVSNCMQGSALVKNCAQCSEDDVTKCFKCNSGYTLTDNTCQASDPSLNCKSDSVCETGYYCNSSGVCTSYVIPPTQVCNRSSDCLKNSTYCEVQSVTLMASCPACDDSTPQIRGCKCGTKKNCKSCDASNEEQCGSCYDGYVLDSGECYISCTENSYATVNCKCGTYYCVAGNYCQNWDNSLFCWKEEMKNCCTFGSLKVQNCQECDTTDLSICKSCENDYVLSNNTCVSINCLIGSTKVENCVKCNIANALKCSQCDSGYQLINDACKVADPSLVCKYDSDCDFGKYCDLNGVCQQYSLSTSKGCMRSIDCLYDNTYCQVQGVTQIASCPTCDSSTPQSRACKCVNRQNCKTCDAENTAKCGSCYDEFNLVDSKCLRSCKTNILLDDECSCFTTACASGKYCQLSSTGVYQCNNELEVERCDSGISKIEQCTKCSETVLTQCIECYIGFSLQGNKCIALNNCQFGSNKIENCKQCDSQNQNKCYACNDGFNLKGEKCVINNNGLSTLQTCLIVCASLLFVIVIALIWTIIRKSNNSTNRTIKLKKDIKKSKRKVTKSNVEKQKLQMIV